MAATTPTQGLLAGLRVFEVGGRLAESVLGMLLAEHGAEVVRVRERPADDPVLEAVLGRGKRELTLDLASAGGRATLQRLAAVTDVLLSDGDAAHLAALGLDAEALRAGPNPGLISCRVPGFPAGHPLASLPIYDAVGGAAGCLYERMLGSPRYHDLPVPSVLGALFAASGVVGALIARLQTGRGQHVESSLWGAALFSQILLVFMKTGVPRGFVPLKLVATPFMRAWRCKDGRYAYLHITLPAHNARMIEVLASSGLGAEARALRDVLSADTIRDPSQVGSIDEAKRIVQVLTRIFLERTADEWEATLGRELCCIKVRTIEEWLDDALEAGMSDTARVDDPEFGPLLTPGPGVVCPEQPAVMRPRELVRDAQALVASWEAAPRPAPTSTPAPTDPRHPLQGVKVADLSRIIAGPCAARILGELGAEVTSIQSPGALDWQLSFHLMFNPGKRSVTVDQQTDEGKRTLSALLDRMQPDVLVQNYRHCDIARQLGVGPETLRERFPSLVYAHLNAYGDIGKWQERPGFEQVVQAVSGIQVSYGTNGVPRLLPTPVIDLGSGLSGALGALLGLYHRRRTGQGVFVTTHLTWVSVLMQVRQVAAVQRSACLQAARGRGVEAAFDADAEVVGGIARVRDGHVVIAGPRRDVRAWLDHVGVRVPSDAANPLAALGRALFFRTAAHWQETVRQAGLAERVAVVPTEKGSGMVERVAGMDLGPLPPVFRKPFPGCPRPLAVLPVPVRLSATPIVDAHAPHLRGADTREVLAGLGPDLPEGAGIVPYPVDKPLLPWLFGLIRWGYFAWRSGSI